MWGVHSASSRELLVIYLFVFFCLLFEARGVVVLMYPGLLRATMNSCSSCFFEACPNAQSACGFRAGVGWGWILYPESVQIS